MLIFVGSDLEKTYFLFNLIGCQPVIDKIYLYTKDQYEAKYQFLLHKCENSGVNHFTNSKAFIEYSNDVYDKKILKITIQINNRKYWSYLMIRFLICLVTKKLSSIVTESFIIQSYFAVPKMLG